MGASPSPPPLLPHLSLVQWLSHQNLSKYVNLFERNGIRDLQDVITVDGNQLKTIGVDSKKDRKSLINAIQVILHVFLLEYPRQRWEKNVDIHGNRTHDLLTDVYRKSILTGKSMIFAMVSCFCMVLVRVLEVQSVNVMNGSFGKWNLFCLLFAKIFSSHKIAKISSNHLYASAGIRL